MFILILKINLIFLLVVIIFCIFFQKNTNSLFNFKFTKYFEFYFLVKLFILFFVLPPRGQNKK